MADRQGFEKLLSPFAIKGVKLRNRMVKLAASLGLADEGGIVSDLNLCSYEVVARGGAGLIIVEHGFVDYPMGATGNGRIGNSEDKHLPGLTKLAEVMHKHGAACFIQLGHAGPSHWKKLPSQPVSSSSQERKDMPHPNYAQARELSIPEIHELVEKFARAAERAQKAGFDGVEMHGAHYYLINSFFSRAWNKRQDAYGGQNLENRTRFAVEILQAIRALVGKDFVVGIRMNGAEYGLKDGTPVHEAQEIAKILVKAGLDYVNVSVHGVGPYNRLIMPEHLLFPEPHTPLAETVKKPGTLVPLAAAIKQVVNVPVITAGRLDAELGELALQQGMADLIGLNRRLFADPEYPNKVAAGRMEDIAPCTACLECMSRMETVQPIRCRINAAFGRGYEFTDIKPADRKKKVLVVGGGPGGMETARVAAIRGHEVSLYEKGSKLGGLLPLAAMIKGTEIEDIPGLNRYLETQVRKLGVQVHLGTEANAALIQAAKPDVVVIATGASPAVPKIPGIERRNVLTTEALHKQAKFFMRFASPELLRKLSHLYMPIGKRVVIIGGLIQGCETAEFLVGLGRKVTIVEESDKLGAGIPEAYRTRLLWWLAEKGVFLLSNTVCDEITDEGVRIITVEGNRQTLEADTILVVIPPVPNDSLYAALKGKVPEVYLIGDAKPDSQFILGAVSDGAEIARAI